jgi:hypothetical protein
MVPWKSFSVGTCVPGEARLSTAKGAGAVKHPRWSAGVSSFHCTQDAFYGRSPRSVIKVQSAAITMNSVCAVTPTRRIRARTEN